MSTQSLTRVIHFLHAKGWAPATSSNYSFRELNESNFYISESSIDKGDFTPENFILVNSDGQPIAEPSPSGGNKRGFPSAETRLHCSIYNLFPSIHCILHTHTIYNTILSQHFLPQKTFLLNNYEILKGLEGIQTHQVTVEIPIFDNTQDIPALAQAVEAYAEYTELRAFLIAGHGMYTWGSTIAAAKRHVEVIEFLLECEYRKLLVKREL